MRISISDKISRLTGRTGISMEINSGLFKVDHLCCEGPHNITTLKRASPEKETGFSAPFSSQLVPHAPFLCFDSFPPSAPSFSLSFHLERTNVSCSDSHLIWPRATQRYLLPATTQKSDTERARRGRRGSWGIKGSENCEGKREEGTDRKASADKTPPDVPRAFLMVLTC